ncbi:methyltransferase domain-containing protein [Thermostichus vulcanus]|uniref:Methyltransferase domain-containing protein n=1 Tax=Thermostichus vulcanus str. 'Rupite' TaxID=2813851 RepID=A0ABT0C732_THEVL|nr:methyltransferase domain-containing protein [Thermostichus vulcanus]MCJ2541597.1 methyltransferase domain-containing protein [Thermostichus vulcanus str. 'Rupite']
MLPSEPHNLEEIAAQGRTIFASSEVEFRNWAKGCTNVLSPLEWGQVLTKIIYPEKTTLWKDIPKTYQEATEAALYQLLYLEPRRAYSLYTALLTPHKDHDEESALIDKERLILMMKNTARELALTASKQPDSESRNTYEQSLKVRELIFELDPLEKYNTLILLFNAIKREDELAVSFYSSALSESISSGSEITDPSGDIAFFEVARNLLDQGYFDIFFDLLETFAQKTPQPQYRSIIAALSLLSEIYLPERFESYKGLYSSEDWTSGFGIQLVSKLLEESTSLGYSAVAKKLLYIAEKEERKSSHHIYLLENAMTFFAKASLTDKVEQLIKEFLNLWPIEELEKLRDKLANKELPGNNIQSLAMAFLFSVSFFINYVSDDRKIIRKLTNLSADILYHILDLHRKNLDPEDGSEKAPAERRSLNRRKLRVGYLGICFMSHSVGIMSHQTLASHDVENNVEVYYYYLMGLSTEELLVSDPIYQDFLSHKAHFRHIPKNSHLKEIIEIIRHDNLDILIHLDSLTDRMSNYVIAYRCAPIQCSWLGGDSSGLPTLDYFLVDPYLLPDSAKEDYREELIQLPTYAAIRHLSVEPQDHQVFLKKLNAKPQQVILFTAAHAYKRNDQCVEAHLQILLNAPNSILVVKGKGEAPSLVEMYRSKAKSLGIEDRIRFLARTDYVSSHRGQLGLFDLMLDTFPYTGATHTMESLYMGLPVLTLVGKHYFGRMSYSLLKNIGLDDCITWSIEEFIQRGIQLANDPERLAKAKQTIRDSYDKSVIWDPKRLARAMEKTYFDLAYRHQLIDQIPDLPNYEPEPKPTERIRLHIGGKEPHPNWKIFNIQPGPNVDYVGNAVDLSQFPDNSLEAIYTSHTLEHFNYTQELPVVLKEWYRALRFGGQLMISVPDLPTLCRLYLKEEATPAQRFAIMRMMFGGQVDEYDYHKVGLSWEHLFMLLSQAGFRIIRKVDRFNLFNDCSEMVVFNELISLNVIATK